jgi:FAD/FMN-containing dehydrogenase
LSNFTSSKIEWIQEQLVAICLKYNGKIYLGKFPFLSPDAYKIMFPKHQEFLAIKKQLDPQNLFWSDAASSFLADV